MRNRKDDIEKYLRGELSPAEMHALEKEALDDPFLAEALEGLEQTGADNFLDDLHRLNRKVHERTRHRKDKTIKIWGWITGMAAAVLLVAVSGFLVVTLLRDQQAREQAMNKQPSAVPESATADSAIVETDADSAEQTQMPPSFEKEESLALDSHQQTEPGERKTERSRQQAAPREAIAQHKDRVQQKADTAIDTVSQPTRVDIADEVIAHEPVTLAEAPDSNLAKKEKGKTDQTGSELLEGRVAGIRAETGAVVRSADNSVLHGRVTSATDGDGLPGVNVMIKGTDIGAVTDVEGNYQLPLPGENSTVVFSYIGFEPLETKPGDKDELNIALKENVASLSEVVVTGYGSSTDRGDERATFRAAEPHGGRSDFKDYLARTIKYPEEALRNGTEGRVTVRFTVEPDGQLTNFEIVRGIGSGCDEELICAIKEGPRWEPSARGDVSVRDNVKVRFKFQLPE